MFLCLAAIFGTSAVKSYLAFTGQSADQPAGHLIKLLMAGFCTLLMLYFGISSFRRARKISRS